MSALHVLCDVGKRLTETYILHLRVKVNIARMIKKDLFVIVVLSRSEFGVEDEESR